ncbi:MAG: IPTL-CTERM sorting domain-containing protein [Pseudomonadota bacterium]
MNQRCRSSMLRFCSILLTAAGASGVWAAPAPDANSVLILSSTDGGSAYSTEATAQGFTAVVETPANWATYTQADFESFRAIILGDPTCVVGTSPIAAAEANRANWSAAVGDGPKIVIGTDEQFHFGQGGAQLIASGISFVTSEPAETGLYISLSCYYDSTATGTPVPVLDQFGAFTVGSAGCFNDAHIVALHPALSGTTDASLSNWGCSVHEVFNSFPGATFIPLAIAEGATGTGEMSFGDGTSGIPYILASGAGIVPVGEAAAIPTLSLWALALLAVVLGFAALRNFRRTAP